MIDLNLDMHAYLSSERVSYHKLKTYDTLGAQGYYRRHIQRTHTPEDTKAYLDGRAFEDALQRPDEYRARYVLKPAGMNFSTTEGKAWRKEQQDKGLTIVEGDTARALEALHESLGACPTVKALIEAASVQPTILHGEAVGEAWGVPGIQSRPDWICLDGCAASEFRPYVLDLKTTSHLRELTSGRAIMRFGYHRQAAMVRLCLQREGVDLTGWRYLIVAAEKAFPYRWQAIEIPQVLISQAQEWCESMLYRIGEHYSLGEWPLVDSEIVTADVPSWAQPRQDDEDSGEIEEHAA